MQKEQFIPLEICRTHNSRVIQETANTIVAEYRSDLSVPHETPVSLDLLLDGRGTIQAVMKASHTALDRELRQLYQEHQLLAQIHSGRELVATRTYTFYPSYNFPTYIQISSDLKVEDGFIRNGIGTALLTADRPFQELAGQLLNRIDPQRTMILATYVDGTRGNDMYWTTRRLRDDRHLPMRSNQYVEEFPVPLSAQRTRG